MLAVSNPRVRFRPGPDKQSRRPQRVAHRWAFHFSEYNTIHTIQFNGVPPNALAAHGYSQMSLPFAQLNLFVCTTYNIYPIHLPMTTSSLNLILGWAFRSRGCPEWTTAFWAVTATAPWPPLMNSSVCAALGAHRCGIGDLPFVNPSKKGGLGSGILYTV